MANSTTELVVRTCMPIDSPSWFTLWLIVGRDILEAVDNRDGLWGEIFLSHNGFGESKRKRDHIREDCPDFDYTLNIREYCIAHCMYTVIRELTLPVL